MESLPITAEAIAFTEKKMDMTLGMPTPLAWVKKILSLFVCLRSSIFQA
jgi:hypothetical protein